MNATQWLVKNTRIVTPAGILDDGWLWMRNGVIAAIGRSGTDSIPDEANVAETADGNGGWLLPGFIDLHVHGGAGFDFMDASREAFLAITRFHSRHGTTSMLATTVTSSHRALTNVLESVRDFMREDMPYARLLGVHIEGPFISPKWRGAQNPAYITPPRPDWLEQWNRAFPGVIRLQTLAPETEGAPDYIRMLVAAGIIPACGHTDATYEEIRQAAACGLRHAVHTFNAMRPYHHREPGTVGAILTDDRIMAEVIADGHHVHPAGIRLLLAAKGADRVILVTDAVAAAGMPNGVYELGGLKVVMADGTVRLHDDGSLAGSALTMIDAFRFMVNEVGVPIPDACKMASANPARQLGLDASIGTLEPGKRADVLLLDDALSLRHVWVGGRQPD
jgi:N-acetylglucosamine-6-phosphate deacetylase